MKSLYSNTNLFKQGSKLLNVKLKMKLEYKFKISQC